jgi:hypothetical protein
MNAQEARQRTLQGIEDNKIKLPNLVFQQIGELSSDGESKVFFTRPCIRNFWKNSPEKDLLVNMRNAGLGYQCWEICW